MRLRLIAFLPSLLLCCAPPQRDTPSGWMPPVPDAPDPIGVIDTGASPSGVVPLPARVDARIRRVFGRYTRVLTPSGRPLHILAQDGWREDQIVRARKVLEHMLTDAPGTRWGHDKAAVAEEMADRRATLVLFDTQQDAERAFGGEFGDVPLGCQDLRANECPVDGDPDYLRHETRDAAFEEILHLVHDYGIRPALPEYDLELMRASRAAQEAGFWKPWPEDEPENQHNEYFAAIYDNYLDLWAAKPKRYEGERIDDDMIPDGTSHFGNYGANSRETLREIDPTGYALIEDFFPPFLTYTAKVDAGFTGTFWMTRQEGLPYTYKSQHLTRVMLAGDQPAHILGNAWDNQLTGNAGDNTLDGRGGDDVLAGGPGDDRLIGGSGRDAAVFSGARDEYRLDSRGDRTVVTDSVPARDGADVLIGVELLTFTDGDVIVPPQVSRRAMQTVPAPPLRACPVAPTARSEIDGSEAGNGAMARVRDLAPER